MIDPVCAEVEIAQIDIQRIMEMIPHRHPFLMIDKVVDVVANRRATGIKNVSINENYFQGHFPARPVMPGVLIIEAMAQTAAVLVVHTLGRESEGKLVYFMSVDNARFRRPVFPGDRLCVHVVKQRNRGNVWKFEGRAKVEDNLTAEAVFAAMNLND
jgi:3-hydroxyacyl-[acyl-carrier-protein] dehydratase